MLLLESILHMGERILFILLEQLRYVIVVFKRNLFSFEFEFVGVFRSNILNLSENVFTRV